MPGTGKSGQEPITGELKGPRGELTTVMLLNGHSIRLLLECVSIPLEEQFSDQRHFSMEGAMVSADTHNRSKYRE